jgi:hypothetical protein
MKVWSGSAWLDAYASLSGALLASNNLSDLANAATARTNLGVAIGTNVQAWDADLDTWATKTAPSGTVVGTSDTQTLSNKTLAGVTNSGNLTFTGTGNRITGDFSNATVANRVAFQTSTTNSNTYIEILPNGTATQAGIDLNNAADPTNSSRFTLLNTGSDVRIASAINGTGTYLPLTMYTGGSERLRIDTSGNVGIGTTTTSSKLEVLGSVVNSISNAGTEDAATVTITNNDVSGLGRIAKTLYQIGGLSIASVSGVYTVFNGSNDIGGALAFSTQTNAAGGVVERMRIDSSGNVGIGTASPATRLHVVSGSNPPMRVEATIGASVIVFKDSTTGATLPYVGSIGNNTVFGQFGGSESMRIDSSGNVGIGTTSPQTKLHLQDNAAVFIQMTDAGDGASRIGQNGTALTFGVDGSSGTTERMRIDSNGNVGIGTTSPSTKLHVSDAAAVSGFSSTSIRAARSNYGADFVGYIDQGVGHGAIISTVDNGTATERMRLTSSGNLQFNSGYGSVATAYGCRAWVNFNGTGTVAIRGSGNVSSITDNGTGDYGVNFTNAMPDTNYSVAGLGKEFDSTSNSWVNLFLGKKTISNTFQTTNIQVVTQNSANGQVIDCPVVNVAVFR